MLLSGGIYPYPRGQRRKTTAVKGTGALLFVVCLTIGCGKQRVTPKSVVGNALTGVPTVQRFVIVNNEGVPVGFLALDTQTGRLCRTWDWEAKDASPLKNTGIDTLTTCRKMLGDDDLFLLSVPAQRQ